MIHQPVKNGPPRLPLPRERRGTHRPGLSSSPRLLPAAQPSTHTGLFLLFPLSSLPFPSLPRSLALSLPKSVNRFDFLGEGQSPNLGFWRRGHSPKYSRLRHRKWKLSFARPISGRAGPHGPLVYSLLPSRGQPPPSAFPSYLSHHSLHTPHSHIASLPYPKLPPIPPPPNQSGARIILMGTHSPRVNLINQSASIYCLNNTGLPLSLCR